MKYSERSALTCKTNITSSLENVTCTSEKTSPLAYKNQLKLKKNLMKYSERSALTCKMDRTSSLENVTCTSEKTSPLAHKDQLKLKKIQ
ncbi:hypothetical protein HB162lentus_25260 [Mammaliicoccus lentus]